ncbi:hypothetical protein [Clostridium estertheticum]|uniref:DUF3784 domain-containing protein n=1 Tax=Clostridium estertheticum TaxID=238834 RepID=A0A7Y3STV2_9CLOT|nr:hypothetical protein [Clostridium estertheticum]MCB2339082.1 hypothetical protein [Clostridium estertheticum]NNU75062.1 hypothetical protein [Clostridium estertheticum]WBL48471.1 hypothetical protein LOR37_07390 [Clostridium estertheticum]
MVRIRIVFSLMLIIGGLIFISLEIFNTFNKATKKSLKDSSKLKKRQIKSQRLLKIITGSCLVVIGTILILNITGDTITILCALIFFLDKLFEFIISKKHKEIN